MKKSLQTEKPKVIRCAIYTRKSTEHGLDQRFSSLDAQRSLAEAFIHSQQHEGWVCLPQHYDDGGFSGKNTERPAYQQLLDDIRAKQIDCVVVYKFDRFSRSVRDFLDMMVLFESEGVSFASVTEQFNTATAIGRLLLHMMLGLAQFEREQVADRTRDKIAATRRKGQWTGGQPLLGYDVVDKKLVVNELEAERIRQVFALYLELGSLLPVVQELARRGWTTKTWKTKNQVVRGGIPITKTQLHNLLRNVTYIGKIAYRDEVHEGEHVGIVDEAVFERVQTTLRDNGHSGCGEKRNKHGALLRGLLHCASCNCGMSHTFTTKGQRRYRYYLCQNAAQNGRSACPAPSLPAAEIEAFVVEEIKAIGRDPALVAATVAESRRLVQDGIKCLKAERAALERQRRAHVAEVANCAEKGDVGRAALAQEHIGRTDQRLHEIGHEQARLLATEITEQQVAAALGQFDVMWAALKPTEQARVVAMLIERVDHDGVSGAAEISFHSTGIKTLAEQSENQETAA